jgi:hypothetical protein
VRACRSIADTRRNIVRMYMNIADTYKDLAGAYNVIVYICKREKYDLFLRKTFIFDVL